MIYIVAMDKGFPLQYCSLVQQIGKLLFAVIDSTLVTILFRVFPIYQSLICSTQYTTYYLILLIVVVRILICLSVRYYHLFFKIFIASNKMLNH